MTKRVLSRLFCIVLTLCLLSSCGGVPTERAAGGVTVTDSLGREVTVPANAVSICTVCPFTGQMAILLGAGDRITSTVNNVSRSELLCEICPSIRSASVVTSGGSINAEEILRLGTDLIFVNESTYKNDDEKAKLDAIGVPCVVIGFETIDEQFEAVRVIGKALGKEEKAETYLDRFRAAIDLVDTTLADVTDPPRLYHSVNEAVRTDEAGSYCAEWISHTKAVNVSTAGGALRAEGSKAYTTLEQIYAWDPDLIVCNEPMVDDYILTDSKWQGLRAVTQERVYQIPVGVTRWGHPNSVETPLALLWLAQLLYPDRFTFDLDDEIREFYRTFYDYTLDDAWLAAIKEADNMRSPKTEKGGEAA